MRFVHGDANGAHFRAARQHRIGDGPGRGFEIELPHWVLLRCEGAPDPEWLGRVVAALASAATRGDAP